MSKKTKLVYFIFLGSVSVLFVAGMVTGHSLLAAIGGGLGVGGSKAFELRLFG